MQIDRFALKKLAKGLALHTRLRNNIAPRYPYLFSPGQLALLCRCLDDTRDVTGCVVEAGCSVGHTTLFLTCHMAWESIEKPYVAIDTFAGFREKDLQVEVSRGKDRSYYRGHFTVNDQRWFDMAMQRAGATQVRSMRADVGTFDFGKLAPIAFCLLDVVFYQPTKLALPRVWEALSPGGIIVVDDCHVNHPYDGAGQAYHEFAAGHGLTPRIEQRKCGLLIKPR